MSDDPPDELPSESDAESSEPLDSVSAEDPPPAPVSDEETPELLPFELADEDAPDDSDDSPELDSV